jgi:hypothetical protein
MGHGWLGFGAAHGIGALWFLVFRRHKRSGVLTVKAFSTPAFAANQCVIYTVTQSVTVVKLEQREGCTEAL